MNKVPLLLALSFLFVVGCKKQDLSRNPKGEYFSARAKIDVETPDQSGKITANIRMKKNETIWIKGNYSIIEVFRALFTRDTVFILNTMKNKTDVYTYKELSEQYNIYLDFEMIQSLLLGDRIEFKGNTPSSVVKTDSSIIITQDYGPAQIIETINPKYKKIEAIDVLDKNSTQSMNIDYSKFDKIGKYYFANLCNIAINYLEEETPRESFVSIDFNRVDFSDEPLNFPFIKPEKTKEAQ